MIVAGLIRSFHDTISSPVNTLVVVRDSVASAIS
jgi:hypothetical protein